MQSEAQNIVSYAVFQLFNSTTRPNNKQRRRDVVYLSLHIAHHVSFEVLICDDIAHERYWTEAAAKEDAFEVMTLADELRLMHKVLYDVVQQRSRQVFALKLTLCKNKKNHHHHHQSEIYSAPITR